MNGLGFIWRDSKWFLPLHWVYEADNGLDFGIGNKQSPSGVTCHRGIGVWGEAI